MHLIEIYVSNEKGNFETEYDNYTNGQIYLTLDFIDMPKGNYLCDIKIGNYVERLQLIKNE